MNTDEVMDYEVPPMLHEKLLTAIGNYAVLFAMMEFHFHSLVWLLINPQDLNAGKHITTEVDLGALIRMTRSLSNYRTNDEALQKRAKVICNQLDEARLRRNIVFHSFWFDRIDKTTEAIMIRIKTRRSGFSEELIRVDEDKLKQDTRLLHDLSMEVQDVHTAYANQLAWALD